MGTARYLAQSSQDYGRRLKIVEVLLDTIRLQVEWSKMYIKGKYRPKSLHKNRREKRRG